MNEEIEFILDTAKEAMNNAIDHLIKELRSIRAGKATPSMLTNVMVDYYGSQTPLSQVANVNTPDARTISIQPWEKNMLQEIEKAITTYLEEGLSFTFTRKEKLERAKSGKLKQFVSLLK